MKTSNFVSTAALACFTLGSAFADQWDKKTILTFDAPVATPTVTLQPGSYTFKLLESTSNRHIVTIWDQDGMNHLTTVLAIPNYRMQPTGKTAVSFWETPAGQPRAMRAWFYPGDNFGQEFAYPKWYAANLTTVAMNRDPVPTLQTDDGTYGRPAPAIEQPEPTHAPAAPLVTENGAAQQASPTLIAKAEPEPAPAPAPEPAPAPAPEPAPTPAPAPAPEPAPAPAPDQDQAAMPATASYGTEALLVALLAAITAAGSLVIGRRSA